MAVGHPTPVIDDITLSSDSVVAVPDDGTIIGDVGVDMLNSEDTFDGILSVDGDGDSPYFRLSSRKLPCTLVSNGKRAVGDYPLTISALDGGSVESPFVKTFTISVGEIEVP